MRGVFVAEEDNFKVIMNSIFDSIWQDGLNMNDDNIIFKVLKNLNINPKTFALRSTSASIRYIEEKPVKLMKKEFWGANICIE